MTIQQIAQQYNLPLEIVAQMERDGVLLTPLLTPEQVAVRYQTKPATIYKLVKSGGLPTHRLIGSRQLRFDPYEIEATLKPQTKTSNVLEMKR